MAKNNNDKFYFKGHHFATEEELKEAQKESEAVEYLKSKTDYNNIEMVVRLYNKTIERKMVTTEVGLDFLKELRETALKNEMITEDKLKPLPVIEKKAVPKPKPKAPTKEQLLEKKIMIKNFVIMGLIVIILGMFAIVMTGKSSPLAVVYEKRIVDTYADWQERLNRQEELIKEQLYFLQKNGVEIPEWENEIKETEETE